MVTSSTGKKYTIRKQPPGTLLPGAHAVDREFAVMRALASTNVPVPKTRFYCDDTSVVGSPFFVYGGCNAMHHSLDVYPYDTHVNRLRGRLFLQGRRPERCVVPRAEEGHVREPLRHFGAYPLRRYRQGWSR